MLISRIISCYRCG